MTTYEHTWEDGTSVTICVADAPPSSKKLYTMLQERPGWGRESMDQGGNGIVRGHNVGCHIVERYGRWQIDQAAYLAGLNLVDQDFKSIITIDLEAEPYNVIWRVGHPRQAEARDIFLQAIGIARAYRPDAKIGIYGWPGATYWWPPDERAYFPNDEEWEVWREAWFQDAVEAVTAQLDFISPSIYDFYDVTPDRDETFVRRMVKLAFDMTDAEKPVYPFVMHRWHNSTAEWGAKLIPRQKHVEHMRWAIDAEADGLISWGADPMYHQVTAGATDAASVRMRQALLNEYPATQTSVWCESYNVPTLIPEIHSRMREAAG